MEEAPCLNGFGIVFKDFFVRSLYFVPGLAAIFFIVGSINLGRQKQLRAVPFIVPIVFVLFLSAFKFYPFYGRVITFLIPLFILLIVYGLQTLSRIKFYQCPLMISLILTVSLIVPCNVVLLEAIDEFYRRRRGPACHPLP